MMGARAAVLLALCLVGCSHVTSVYQADKAPKLAADSVPEVKRVRVAAWAPKTHPSLASALQAVATDYLKLRKNYLVFEAGDQAGQAASAASWSAACSDRVEGVLYVRALAVAQNAHEPPTTDLALSVELLRCQDGALLYRSEGHLKRSSGDRSLTHLRAHYAETLGADKGLYVACSFSLLQELLSPLPDPVLSESELEEKIELGACLGRKPSEDIALGAQRRKARERGLTAELRHHHRVGGAQKWDGL